jgi:glutathione synthase/RimK-type ligase-like ATP-grasp enzyme
VSGDAASERLVVASLRRSAERRGLAFETFGHGWVVRLGDGRLRRHVIGYDFELNSTTAAKIAGDKAATAALLEADGVPAVPHRLFLRPDVAPVGIAGNDRAAMAAHCRQLDWDTVVKTNAGTGGKHVYRVRSQGEMDDAVEAVFAVHHAAALSPFLTVDGEYRVVMLDEAAHLVYEKLPGDGEWRHNLGLGGTAADVEDDALRKTLTDLAVRALRAIGLRFGSVDIVAVGDRLSVLEVNAGVMMEHYGRSSEARRRRVDEIYDRAVAAMFA